MFQNGPKILFLFRYGKANRAGDNCHGKEIVTQSSQGEGAWHAMQGHTGKHQGRSGGRKSKGKAWVKAFIVLFQGKEWARIGEKLGRLTTEYFD